MYGDSESVLGSRVQSPPRKSTSGQLLRLLLAPPGLGADWPVSLPELGAELGREIETQAEDASVRQGTGGRFRAGLVEANSGTDLSGIETATQRNPLQGLRHQLLCFFCHYTIVL